MSRYGFGGDQWFDDNGKPLSQGKLYFYETGTSTPKVTYSNVAMTIPHSAYVTLDAAGRQPDIFFDGIARLVVQSAASVQIDDSDPVYPIGLVNIGGTYNEDAVSSVALLRALSVPADDGVVIELLGYIAAGDGGGGLMHWKANSAAADDGGTVFLPTGHVGNGRWLRRYSGALDIKWFGAIPGSDALAGITSATEAGEALGLSVLVSAGAYTVSDYIPMLDGMDLIGEGPLKSVIQKASGSANDRIINKVTPETQFNSFSMRGIGLVGDRAAQTAEVTGSSLVAGRTIDNINIENCRFSEGRGFGLNFNICKNVRVVNNDFENIYRDMCGVWCSTRVLIEGNNFLRNDDDCISVNTSATNGIDDERQTSINIQGNILTDSGGIRCMHGKNLTIANNTLFRTKSSKAGIFVGFDNGVDFELANPHGVLITNNNISDFIDNAARSGGAGSENSRVGIRLEGMPAVVGGLAAAPKELDVATGTLVAPYSYNYANAGAAGTDPVPRMFNIKVSDNLVVRTLPSGVDYSEWGYGEMFTRLSGTGWTDPAMTEAYMSCTPLVIQGPVRTMMIQNNHFNATGNFGIWFDSFEQGVPANNFDIDDVHIFNNLIKNTKTTAIELSTDYDGTYLDIRVDSNIIDCDPDLVSTGRIETAGVLTGGWSSIDALVAINYKQTIGCQFFRNVFKNCSSPFISSGTGEAEFEQNVIEGQPALPLFDVTNLGVGYVPDDGRISKVVYRDSAPSSATYSAMLEYAVTQVGGAAPPTEGFYIRGYFMPIRSLATVTKNGVSQAILGYKRLITGKAHVVGTDWQAVYVEL